MAAADFFLIFLNVMIVLQGLSLLGFGIAWAVSGGFSFFRVTLTGLNVSLKALAAQAGYARAAVWFFFYNCAVLLIGFAIITLFIAIWGIVAGIKRYRILVTVSAVLLFLLFIVEASVTCIVGVASAEKTRGLTIENFRALYGGPDPSPLLFESDLLEAQIYLKCCAINGPFDYTIEGLPVPSACMRPEGYPYMTGCAAHRGNLLPYDWIFVAILITFSFLTLFTFIFTLVYRALFAIAPKKMTATTRRHESHIVEETRLDEGPSSSV